MSWRWLRRYLVSGLHFCFKWVMMTTTKRTSLICAFLEHPVIWDGYRYLWDTVSRVEKSVKTSPRTVCVAAFQGSSAARRGGFR